MPSVAYEMRTLGANPAPRQLLSRKVQTSLVKSRWIRSHQRLILEFREGTDMTIEIFRIGYGVGFALLKSL